MRITILTYLETEETREHDVVVDQIAAALKQGGHEPSIIGVDGKSLVHTAPEMMDRVRLIHEKVHDAALVEEYIEGREFYVGVLGNHEPIAFPPIEMDFSGMPEDAPHILDAKAKWQENSP